MTGQYEAHEQIINHWTYQLEALLLQIAAAAQENNKQYYIGGGLAVDLTFGGFSRSHEDIDFHPLEEDTQWWKDWFVRNIISGTEGTSRENIFMIFVGRKWK